MPQWEGGDKTGRTCQVYFLDREPVSLRVGGVLLRVGIAWMSHKFHPQFEFAPERTMADDATEWPEVVIVGDCNAVFYLASDGQLVVASRVLGWEIGRRCVSEIDWDCLPTIGYGIKSESGENYVLHEAKSDKLYLMGADRARELSILDHRQRLVPHGQVPIDRCDWVEVVKEGKLAVAECYLANGRRVTQFVLLNGWALPPKRWFENKLPMEAMAYSGERN